jgi:hypothetical protein
MTRLILVLSVALLTLTGCPPPANQKCNVNSTLTARVVVTSLGTAARKFEVRASGFTPNAQARITIQNFPKSEDINQTVTLDASGSLVWTTTAPLILTTDPTINLDAEVRTTLVETNSQCFGIAMTKERDFTQM